jgi:hypothetical protein
VDLNDFTKNIFCISGVNGDFGPLASYNPWALNTKVSIANNCLIFIYFVKKSNKKKVRHYKNEFTKYRNSRNLLRAGIITSIGRCYKEIQKLSPDLVVDLVVIL